MANKKRRANAASPGGSTPPRQPGQPPTRRASSMLSTLRLVALMSATIVALLVFEALQNAIGFWPALGVAFAAGILARLFFVWLERVWLGAAARRAIRRRGDGGAPGE